MTTKQSFGGKSKQGAPVGNKNAHETYCIRSAIRKALAQYSNDKIEQGHALRAIAERAVVDAVNGDKAAREWLSERMEGKASQTINWHGDLAVTELSAEERRQRIKELEAALR